MAVPNQEEHFLSRRGRRILEFFVIGVAMGIVEDMIAILWATNAAFEVRIVWVAAAVAIPFAVISELIVDQPHFWHKLFKFFGIKKRKKL